MSLELITGSSGSGKSYTVYRELIEDSLRHPEKQYLVIVPEQFTMQTQKEIVRMHPRHGLLNVDVLSFNRLSWRVFEEVGGNTLPVLEELGKSLVVQRVIAEQQDSLTVLGRTLSRQGSVQQMKSLISEFLQYGVEPGDLEDWKEQLPEGMLAHKLEDVRVLYEAFRAYLQDHYLTTEEVPDVLCRVIGKSRLIRGSVIILDEFTGFTPVQYKVIRELLKLAEKVIIPVTMDTSENPCHKGNPHQLFYMSRETISRTIELAREAGTEVLPVRSLETGDRSRFSGSRRLQFLEQHLFRPGRAVYEETGESEKIKEAPVSAAEQQGSEMPDRSEEKRAPHRISEIGICEASEPRSELRHIAAQILRMVRENGYRYRDFALVTGDLETYGKDAAEIFEAAGIPCFLDQKQPVLTNPLVECIRAALQMVENNYSYDSVFRFLRSGMTDFTREETDELENYVLAMGIRGRKQYAETWIKLPKHTDPEKMAYLNTLRERFVLETQDLHEGMRDRSATVRDKTAVLYRFLLQYRPQEKLQDLSDSLEEAGELSRAKEYRQIYAAVIDLFDKLVEVLGDEKLKTAAFADVLDAGFAEMRIGLIPPGEDQVMIGDIERTRLKTIRVLFFAGINEGVIPKPVKAGGILSEIDREKLEKADADLAPTAREEMYRQRFYLYLAMTKPSDALYLSYSRAGKEGQTLLPSYLIGVVRQMFPDLVAETETKEVQGSRQKTWEEAWETPAGRTQHLLDALQMLHAEPVTDETKELILWLREQPDGLPMLQMMLAAAGHRNEQTGIGRMAAEELYGRELVNTATRLELFAGCAFAHFCEYGLHLQERDIYSFTPMDFGTVMHNALERFAVILRKEGISWKEMTDAQRDACADQALEEVVHGYRNNLLHDTAKNTWMIARIREMLHRTVWALQMQVKRGDFRPSDFECGFTDDLDTSRLQLTETGSMKLRGRIDRLDLCEKDGTEYVKVIDYKTGSVAFDLNRVFSGQQLQLLLYLNAAVENEQKKHPDRRIEPAGVFYYHIEDPYVQTDGPDDPEKTEKAILHQLRPNGKCRSEREVLELLDRTLYACGGAADSDVIPVKVNKDGTLSAYSQTADSEAFHLLRDYTEEKSRELGRRILSGETQASPLLYGTESACQWCDYKGICGFDERIPGYACRRQKKQTEDDLYKLMKEELEAAGAGRYAAESEEQYTAESAGQNTGKSAGQSSGETEA